MSVEFDDREKAKDSIANIIRNVHSGLCSGFPKGVSYPGVPSVEGVADKFGIDLDDYLTEVEWCDIWEYLE